MVLKRSGVANSQSVLSKKKKAKSEDEVAEPLWTKDRIELFIANEEHRLCIKKDKPGWNEEEKTDLYKRVTDGATDVKEAQVITEAFAAE